MDYVMVMVAIHRSVVVVIIVMMLGVHEREVLVIALPDARPLLK